MNGIGDYPARESALHRLSPGPKLLLLVILSTLVLTVGRPLVMGGLAIGVISLYAVARIPVADAVSGLAPAFWFLVPLFGFQWLAHDLRHAGVLTGQILLVLALAALVTWTTRVSAMLDTFERLLRPLRRFGVDGDRVALLLALTVRCIPMVRQCYAEAREAQRARGAERNPVALAVPLVIRLLRKADRLGEALTARGVDD